MKSISTTRLQTVILIFIRLVLLVIVFMIAFLQPSQPKPTLRSAYDPAQFGIPDTLAGYRVVGVFTEENSVCMQPGEKDLLLETQISELSDHLDQIGIPAVNQALVAIGINPADGWQFTFSGPGVNQKAVFSQQNELNAQLRENGCGLPLLN